jgi:hypothetical protein
MAPSNGILLLGGYNNVPAKVIVNGVTMLIGIFQTVALAGVNENTSYTLRVNANDVIYISVPSGSINSFNVHIFNPITS